MFRRLSIATTLLVLIACAPKSAHAQFTLKLGAQFKVDGGARLDTSDSNWILGQSTDKWFGKVIGLSYETDFSYDSQEIAGEKVKLYSLFNFVNLKLRVPGKNFKPYVGGGIGYSPMLLSFDGNTNNIGGFSGQLLAGVSLADHFCIEGQYKMTDIENSSSQRLFTIFGGFSF